MDFQYAFRQANKDRLEDAGVVQYGFTEGFSVVQPKHTPRRAALRRLRPVLVSIVNLVMR